MVALNLCLKPVVDELFMMQLPALAKQRDDFLLGQIFASLDEDCRWHRDWTIALLEAAIRNDEGNRAVIAGWVQKWTALSVRAGAALSELIGTGALALAGELQGRIGVGGPGS